MSLFFTSCGDDDGDEVSSVDRPTISLAGNANGETYITDDVTLQVGSEIKFLISASENATSKKNLRTVVIDRIFNNDRVVLLDTAISDKEFGPYEVVEYAQGTAGSEIFNIVVTDKDNVSSTVSITITTEEPFTEKNGQFFHIASANAGAFDLVADMNRTSGEDDLNKDMVNTDEAATNQEDSKFTGSWESANGTLFKASNASLYDNPTNLGFTWSTTLGDITASSAVSNPSVGDVYLAKLRGNANYVVIKVTDIKDVAMGNTGEITFSYKK